MGCQFRRASDQSDQSDHSCYLRTEVCAFDPEIKSSQLGPIEANNFPRPLQNKAHI